MATTVSMPQLGETVTEGTILRWAKQVGDSVAVDEVLVEISTDKVDTEVPSPAAGVVLEILVEEGATVEVGTALAVIGEEGESSGSDAGAPAEDAAEPQAQESQAEEAQPEEAQPEEAQPQQAQPQEAQPQQAESEEAPPAAGGGTGESTTVTMPQLGETVTEGTILRWAKQVGDSVAADEVLVEISTDKVDTEIPSPAAGTLLEILVEEGATVEVGAALATIGAEGAAPSSGGGAPAPEESPASREASAPQEAAAPAAPDQADTDQTTQQQAAPEAAAADSVDGSGKGKDPGRADGSGRLLSPVVRKLVRQHGLDPDRITGTGEGGRITRKDVEKVIEQGGTPQPAEPAQPQPAPEPAPAAQPEPAQPEPAQPEPAQPAAAPAPSAPAAQPSRPAAAAPPAQAGDETVELDRLRVRIGEKMIQAKQTAAHVWASVEVDYERVERVRQRHKEAFKEAEGFSLTYLPFIARATIDALHEYPVVNSSLYLEDRKAVYHRSVNLGIAIDLDQKGLVVASVRDADGLRLVGIARQIRALAQKARDGKLEPDDVSGSTFSITNPGPYGSFMTAPIINVPNTGILSTDTVAKRPAVVEGADGQDVIAIRHIGYLGLTWDHRAFDGSTAVLFMQRIKQNLETWDWEQELA